MQAIPGPDTTFVVSRGIGQGTRVALLTVLGMTVGSGLLQVPLLALGLASVARDWPLAFEILRWAGAAYLIWLGLRLIWGRELLTVARAVDGPRSAWAAGREGMVVNLLNPNPPIFMLALLPQFVDPAQGSVTLQLLLLGATQKASGFVILAAVALGSGALGSLLAGRVGWMRWQQRAAGLAMVALGFRLLVPGGRP